MPTPNADDPLRTTDHPPPPQSAVPPELIATDAPPDREGGGAPSVSAGQSTVTFQPQPDAPSRAGSATTPAEPQLPSIPGYEIESVLGRGGMGVVYKARHLTLKRTVALKMVRAGGHAGPGELARFRIEAEAAARLQHPNIVQIHEVGAADGQPYRALEFVEGGNLASKIKGKPLPAREAAKLVESLARAMQLAHSRNVVHRDLKPANILLTPEGTPKITDFGLARQLDSDSGETQAGAVMGTPSYMAPEQASGRAHEAGPAADVYALGAILYTCLVGRPPFKGKTTVETLDQVRTQEPVPPSRLQVGVPLDLETICLKCLRKEPEKRYASAAELADELVRYQHGEPILARPVGQIERLWRWCVRKPALASMAGGLAAVIVTAFIVVVWQLNETTAALAREESEKQQRKLAEEQRALAQVNALRDAAPGAVPGILADLEVKRGTVLPRLRARFAEEVDRAKRMRLALALIAVEPEQVRDALAAWMLQVEDPAEVLLVRDALAPHKGALLERLWAAVDKAGKGTEHQRLRAAAALAKYDRDNPRWERVRARVVEDLVAVNLVFLGQWREAFQPVKGRLLSPLSDIFREQTPERIAERKLATTLLADYAAGQPQVLAGLLMDADEKQFAVLYPKFKEVGERGLPLLTAEIDKRAVAAKDKVIFESKGTVAKGDARVQVTVNQQRGSLHAKRFEVRLQAGKMYRLTMDSKELDSFLVLQDRTGKPLAVDDDGGGDLNSLLVFIPSTDDTYTVFAASLKGTGSFELKVVEKASGDGGKEKLAKRQANAAVALLKMNRPEKVWPLLKHSPDPRVRSYLIHRLYSLGADGGAMIERLKAEPDITIRRALLLSLGEYREQDLSPEDRQGVLAKVQGIYRTDADPGLHAASEWLLRQWQEQAWLKKVNDEWARDGDGRKKKIDGIQERLTKGKGKTPPQWYVNGQGQTMVVIPGPVEFTIGSPPTEAGRPGGPAEPTERQVKKAIKRHVVLASKEVTVGQFLAFREDHRYTKQSARTQDCPVNGVSWYDAAAYCNWLSDREGLERCYEANAVPGGMKMKANYLELSGYRLPTEAEWEYACRAGGETSRYYGESEELLGKYAWYTKNSQDRWLLPVGGLKPNDFGLFDMLGNVLEWCQGGPFMYVGGEDKEDIRDSDSRVLRGGSFLDPASDVRCAYRVWYLPSYRYVNVGFRPARTLPPGSFTALPPSPGGGEN